MRQGRVVRVLAVAGVLLAIGVALCAFDDDGVDDLCLMSLALHGSMLGLLPLPVAGQIEWRPVASHPSMYVDLPSPPPRA